MKIDPSMIPDEVVEPIARAICAAEGHDPDRLRRLRSDKLWTAWSDEARAALAAALNAWAGACIRTLVEPDPNNGGQWILPVQMLSLPLPKEGE